MSARLRTAARVVVFGALLAVGLPASVVAQDARLGRALDSLAASWARGDAAGIATFVARAGLSLAVDQEPIGPLGPRQAAAVLRRLFEERETVRLERGVERVVGGAPPRAFGELTWLHRMRGTTIPERTVVFLALVREADGWRVTEIRFIDVR